ncbi:MAG: LptF/LptG family permease [Treponema sp.]|nr:LptF/LptG family permease [Treponema sp.]
MPDKQKDGSESLDSGSLAGLKKKSVSVKEALSMFGNHGLRKQIYRSRIKSAERRGDGNSVGKIRKKLELVGGVKRHVLIRYIARELFVYFFVCFLFFFVIFFVNQILLLAADILKQRVPIPKVLELIVYCLPAIVAQSAPFATLLGFLMCLGRMVTDNEILILRASGQRYSIILIPVLIMGLLISTFSFVMNDYFLPLGTLRFNRLKTQIVQSDPAVQIEANSIKRMSSTALVIGDAEGSDVDDLVIFDRSSSDGERIIIAGKSTVEKSSTSGLLMDLLMSDPILILLKKNERSTYDIVTADTMRLNMFESSISASGSGVNPQEMTSYDLNKTIRTMVKEKAASARTLNNYRIEYYKKFSIPFGAIFFAILAFPLALVFGKRNGLTLGFIFGIIISVLYWAMTIMGQYFGIRGGYNGFWMVWTPNFVIGIVGILLYFRLKKK